MTSIDWRFKVWALGFGVFVEEISEDERIQWRSVYEKCLGELIHDLVVAPANIIVSIMTTAI